MCVSEGDQEEYDDVKNSNEDGKKLGRLLSPYTLQLFIFFLLFIQTNS